MSVTSHLKDLLIKMGGTPKDGDSTSVLIDKIEDVYDGSGSGGNNPVSNDSGLSGVFVIKMLVDNAVDSVIPYTLPKPEIGSTTTTMDLDGVKVTLKLDKTLSQIENACKNNVPIYLYVDGPCVKATIAATIADNVGTVIVVPNSKNNSSKLIEYGHDKDGLIWSEESFESYAAISDDFAYTCYPDQINYLTIVNNEGMLTLNIGTMNGKSIDYICQSPDEYPLAEQELILEDIPLQ